MAWASTKWVRLDECQFVRKTEKAIYIFWRGDHHWLPLSQVKNPEFYRSAARLYEWYDIDISDWIAKQKDIDPNAKYDEDEPQEWVPPPSQNRRSSPWWMVLGLFPAATEKEVKKRYHQLAREHHPDRGGTHEAMVKLNLAMDQYRSMAGVR